MKTLTMNEVQDLLEALNACAYEALEALNAGKTQDCRTAIRAIIDEVGQHLEGEED